MVNRDEDDAQYMLEGKTQNFNCSFWWEAKVKTIETIFFVFLFYQAFHEQTSFCFNYVWLREEHQGAQHLARHAFSFSGNYVHLEPVAGTLPCGQTQIIKAYYTLNGQALGEPKELIFYYLVRIRLQNIFGVHR